jgi:hypothetical protein
MNSTLHKILRKVGSVQRGLLRVQDEDKKLLLQTRAGTDEQLVNCIINDENCSYPLLRKDRNVSLIQKDKEDYLYISCRVKEEVRKDAAVIISMEVLRACWFTRQSTGSVTWLKEKYMYDAIDIAS